MEEMTMAGKRFIATFILTRGEYEGFPNIASFLTLPAPAVGDTHRTRTITEYEFALTQDHIRVIREQTERDQLARPDDTDQKRVSLFIRRSQSPFNLEFRGAREIPAGTPDEDDSDFSDLLDLWFDERETLLEERPNR